MKDADKVMDTATKERYLRQVNYQNRMKIQKAEEEKKAFQKEEERAFKMIPARPIPFEIKTEDVKSANKITNMQAAVSAQATSVNILPPDNIYDDIYDVDIERNMKVKFTLHNNPLTHGRKLTGKDQDQNSFPMPSLNRIAALKIHERAEETGINTSVISNQGSTCNQPRLPETPHLEVRRSKLKSKFKLIGVCIAVMMVVAGLCWMVSYFTPSYIDNPRVNATDTNDVPVTTYDPKCISLVEKKITADIIVSGNITQVRELIHCGASVNSHDEDGCTPLYFSAMKGNINLTQLLLTHNASVDKADLWGNTPLYEATRFGHVNVIRLLHAYKASVDMVYYRRCTLLHVAAEYGYADLAQLLLAYNVKVDKAREDGCTPLFVASKGGNVDVVEVLLRHNASVDRHDDQGNTPLLIASEYNKKLNVQILLTNSASVDKANLKGHTPLYKAAWNGHARVVEMLLTYNASVNKTYSDGRTPLYEAALGGYINVVQILLRNNATVNKADKRGWTPLHAAMWPKNKDKARCAIVEALYKAGAHINAQSTRVYFGRPIGSTALHIAVFKRNKSRVKKLMLYTTNLSKNSQGKTALDMARYHKLTEITKEFIY